MDTSDAARSSQKRRFHLILFGILLLFAFALPIVNQEWNSSTKETESKVVFVNIEVLGEEGAPTELQLFMLFFGVAGLAVLLIAILVPAPGRSVWILGLGAAGLVLMLLVMETLRKDEIQALLTMTMGGKIWAVLIGMVATTLLIGGSRARWYAAESRLAAILAGTGGALALLAYVLPSMPDDSLAVGAPFEVMDRTDGSLLGIVLLLSMVMVILAAILALANPPRKVGPKAARLGNLSFWLVVGSMLVLFVGAWVAVLTSIGAKQDGVFVPVTLAIVKWACMAIGIGLLAPLGIADLIASRHRTPADAEAASAVSARLDVLARERRIQRRIHELRLLRDEGHMSDVEYLAKKRTLEDML